MSLILVVMKNTKFCKNSDAQNQKRKPKGQAFVDSRGPLAFPHSKSLSDWYPIGTDWYAVGHNRVVTSRRFLDRGLLGDP